MNKFEQQKEEIIERIEAGASYLDFNTNMDNEDIDIMCNSVSIRLSQAIDALKELQPPTSPTCATCNKLHTWKEEVDYNLIIDKFSCKRYHGFPINAPYIQSCLHHSDYEKAANK